MRGFGVRLLLLAALVWAPPAQAQVSRVAIVQDTVALLIQWSMGVPCRVYSTLDVVIDTTCNWTSRNPAVATVVTPAKRTTIKALRRGITWIVAGRSGKKDSVKLLVGDQIITRPATVTLNTEQKRIFCALLPMPNGQVVLPLNQANIQACKDRAARYEATH